MKLKQKAFYTAAAISTLSPTAILASDLRNGAQKARGGNTGPDSISTAFQDIANILMFLVGAISVIVIIYGGFRYVTSTGDAARIKGAKDTILYGITGLVVAIMAYAIVYFVVNQLTN